MKRTLRRNWRRVKLPNGRLFYFTPISEYFITQVWHEGSSWQWAAVGFTRMFTEGSQPNWVPLIAKHGTGQTMNEACWYAEQWLPPESQPDEQTLLWLNPVML